MTTIATDDHDDAIDKKEQAASSSTCAAEISQGAERLASELREFIAARDTSNKQAVKSSGFCENIGSASWPAVQQDKTADLQLATCRKLREVSI